MYKYKMTIIWSDEDKAFIVEVPELPGCLADGATYQEAVSNAEVIIDEWIKTAKTIGRPVPKPGRSIQAQLPAPQPAHEKDIQLVNTTPPFKHEPSITDKTVEQLKHLIQAAGQVSLGH